MTTPKENPLDYEDVAAFQEGLRDLKLLLVLVEKFHKGFIQVHWLGTESITEKSITNDIGRWEVAYPLYYIHKCTTYCRVTSNTIRIHNVLQEEVLREDSLLPRSQNGVSS